MGRGDRLGHRVAIDDGIIVAAGVGDLQGAFDRGEPPDLGGLGLKIRLAIRTKKKCELTGHLRRQLRKNRGQCDMGAVEGRVPSTNGSSSRCFVSTAHYSTLGLESAGVHDIVGWKKSEDTIIMSDSMTEGSARGGLRKLKRC